MDKRLYENLKNVQQNYIAPFLWLHNEPDNQILTEIQRIYESGIRSVCLESRTHEEFCREDWWSDVKLILDACRERDMQVWILDDKHFPSGYANGIFEEKYKDLQPFGITERHIDVTGPVTEGAAMADCWLTDREDELVAVAACRNIPGTGEYDQIIDITDGLSGRMVYFTLPEGIWRIVFLIKTRSGIAERHLPFCDMLNPKTIDLFIEEVYETHYARFSEYFGNTFLGFFSDEPSFLNNTENSFDTDFGVYFAHHPWHDSLKERFSQKLEQLAGLWLPIRGTSEAIRHEFMDVITREYQKNFVDKIGDWCRNHQVMYIGHIIEDNNTHARTGNGPGHYFRALHGQDMSGVDVVLHQIMPGFCEYGNIGFNNRCMNPEFFSYYLAKLGSSFAHIDPLKKGRAMCEIFGAYGWAEGTKIMKYLMDHMLVRGINYFVPHAFSPLPNDTDCPPNFYDSGNNPQYKFFKKNMDYLNRMSHMLSDGQHVATCAILYDAENHWVNQEFLPLEKIAKKLYDNCYDYDIIPVDYLDKIKGGSLNGETYSVLFVPYTNAMPEAVLQALNNADIQVVMVQDGARTCAYDFEAVSLNDLPAYMESHGYADVKTAYEGIYLRTYHYRRNGAEIYMFVNEDMAQTIDTTVSLSAFSGGSYIEYDGFENEAWRKSVDGKEIPISLAPYHATMLVFGDVAAEGIGAYEEQSYAEPIELHPEFQISIAEGNGTEFHKYKTAHKLFNITGREELPDFSGHIQYETKLKLDQEDWLLDLGYVGEVAEVSWNGRPLGTQQIPPYRFQLSKEQVEKENTLTVVVSNHNGYAKRDRFSQYLMFEPSGMLGPITIRKKNQK